MTRIIFSAPSPYDLARSRYDSTTVPRVGEIVELITRCKGVYCYTEFRVDSVKWFEDTDPPEGGTELRVTIGLLPIDG